jgi:hypothetical protein
MFGLKIQRALLATAAVILSVPGVANANVDNDNANAKAKATDTSSSSDVCLMAAWRGGHRGCRQGLEEEEGVGRKRPRATP